MLTKTPTPLFCDKNRTLSAVALKLFGSGSSTLLSQRGTLGWEGVLRAPRAGTDV